MWEPADFKFSDMLGVAGATVGIIIAGGILLGWLNAKYIDMFARYRSLSGEHRDDHSSDGRRVSLQEQISRCRWQISLLSYGSISVTLALLLFLVTVILASLSVIYTRAMLIRAVGTVTLFAGLLLIALGMAMGLMETVIQRKNIGKEISDFSDIPSTSEAMRR